MICLINTSKTMVREPRQTGLRSPALLAEAEQLATILQAASPLQLGRIMHISKDLAAKTHELMAAWSGGTGDHVAALDAFQGDIYRGLRAQTFSSAQRKYADESLRILSGLYGIIRPLDGVEPYRLELMYKLKGKGFSNLYEFWGKKVAEHLPSKGPIINLASAEYFKVVDPFVDAARVVEPQFLSRKTTGANPDFVAVHAKAARGALARWIIRNQADGVEALEKFDDLGYRFDADASTPERPTFIRTGPLSMLDIAKQLD